MDIIEITDADPRRVFVQIARIIRPTLSPPFDAAARQAVIDYCTTLQHAALGLEIGFDVALPEPLLASNPEIDHLFARLRAEIERQEIKVVIERVRAQAGGDVSLDPLWRSRLLAYLAHIRRIVDDAPDLQILTRDAILRTLQLFESQADRGRTSVQAFMATFIGLCEGVSLGATTLAPALRLGQKIIGALACLHDQPPVVAAAQPDSFDLPAPETLLRDMGAAPGRRRQGDGF